MQSLQKGTFRVYVSTDSRKGCPMWPVLHRCKTLSATADGYSRAEAACVMLLTAIDAAVEQPPAEGAVSASLALFQVPGSAVGQDGRSSALTAPNGPAQQSVITAALEAAVLRPADVASLQVPVIFVTSPMAVSHQQGLLCCKCDRHIFGI